MYVENKKTELKREYVDDIKNTIIAFANCDGGKLYIGINDDGTVCGISDVDGTMLRATNALRDSVRPDITMFMECSNITIESKNVICISVQRGTARPYYLHGKGIRPEGVYVRQGASTVPASDAAILAMIKESSGDSYEAARSLEQQLTFEHTRAYFEKRNIDLGKPQMKTLHLIGNDEAYTNLAFLLSEQCSHTIKMAVFEGDKKTVFKDRKELTGSLLEQLEEAYDYIDRYNRTRAEFSGLERIDRRDYPIEAVREALLNAIVHRDYAFSGSTLISIFENRMEIVTIGGLAKGISLDDVNLGVSVLRNQNLANVFYRLKLIEAYGTGIMKINESYEEYQLKPLIETSSNAFKITLPNVNYQLEQKTSTHKIHPAMKDSFSKQNHRFEQILTLCRKKGGIVRKDVERELKVSQATAINLLLEMTEKGLLLKDGRGKNIRYTEKK